MRRATSQRGKAVVSTLNKRWREFQNLIAVAASENYKLPDAHSSHAFEVVKSISADTASKNLLFPGAQETKGRTGVDLDA